MQFDDEFSSCDPHITVDGTAEVTYQEDQIPFEKGVGWSTYLPVDKEVVVKSEERLFDVSSLALEIVHAELQAS